MGVFGVLSNPESPPPPGNNWYLTGIRFRRENILLCQFSFEDFYLLVLVCDLRVIDYRCLRLVEYFRGAFRD